MTRVSHSEKREKRTRDRKLVNAQLKLILAMLDVAEAETDLVTRHYLMDKVWEETCKLPNQRIARGPLRAS
jgi:hypothetical protein